MSSSNVYAQHPHHSGMKKESNASPSRVYSQQTDSSSGPHYVKLQNSYTVQQAGSSPYSVLSAQSSNNGRHSSAAKYEKYDSSSHVSSIKTEGKMQKYIVHSSQTSTNSTSHKSKPHSSTHNTVQSSISRRRKSDKVGKGLRHFSMKVCEKVKEKGSTTYNEVADELVAEEVQNQSFDSPNCDQKNIRRRVYDALNVLMAMNIISKDKKEIRWIGLPTNSVQQCNTIEKENQKRRERIQAKMQELKELLMQQVSFKSLVERNREAEKQGIIPTPNSSIQLPFIIVNTHKSTKINCSVSTDKSEYYFKFNDKFEIHDDVEVLKRMGLLLGLDKGECTYEAIEKAKSMVPKNFEKYIELYGRGQDELDSDWEIPLCDMTDLGTGVSRTIDQSPDHGDLDDDDLISESSDIE